MRPNSAAYPEPLRRRSLWYRSSRRPGGGARWAGMSYQVAATILGVLLQLGGAAYLVFQSSVTTRKLAKYKSNITYGNFAAAIDDLAHEVHGQFAQQFRGFIALAVGLVLQLSGAIPA